MQLRTMNFIFIWAWLSMITRIQANKIYDCIGIYSTKDWHESTDRTGFHTEKGKVKDQYCWDYHTQCPAHMTNTGVMIWSVCLVINGMTMMIFRGGKTCPAGHNPVSLQGPPCHSLKTIKTALCIIFNEMDFVHFVDQCIIGRVQGHKLSWKVENFKFSSALALTMNCIKLSDTLLFQHINVS